VLVETGVVSEDDGGGISDIVAARTRTPASFRQGGGSDAVWALAVNGDTVAHARLDPLTQNDWRDRLVKAGRRFVLPLLFAAMVAVAVGWLRLAGAARPGWAGVLPLGLMTILLALMPMADLFGIALFSPLLFALPLPGGLDLTLGRALAVAIPLAALVAGARRGPWARQRLWIGLASGALVILFAYPLAVRGLLGGSTTALLRGSSAYWLALQLTGTVVLASVTFLAIPRVARPAAEDDTLPWFASSPRLLLGGALVLSVLLAMVAATRVRPDAPLQPLFAALWAIPFAAAALALSPASGRAGAVARWIVAGWLAGTAVLPHMWAGHVRAQLEYAENELRTLGTRSDPYLEYLLLKFAHEGMTRFNAGEDGVQLLYRTWVASGLANEPYPARIVLWAPSGIADSMVAQVQLGTAPAPIAVDDATFRGALADVRQEGVPLLSEYSEYADLSKMLAVPLADGSLVTVMVPPRRTLDRPSSVAPFLGGISPASTRLNLVEGAGAPPPGEQVEWRRTPLGWRSEAAVLYPDGWYHAHLSIAFPALHIRVARGALLLTFDLAVLALLWAIGVTARGGAAIQPGVWSGWLGSFRARVTMALFAFFLVPTAVFGWIGYTALSSEVARAAETVAQHSVAQAVREFEDGNADLRDLAAHAGTDVLRYFGGELFDVSSREALDLGVYNAWMPAPIYERLRSGEDEAALDEQRIGAQSYVTAYHSIRPTGTLGVPMSLSSGDAAERQGAFAHLVLFAVILGALLSLALSVAVGRALAGPIGLLSRASAAVGAGRVRIRLPENSRDEFGQLYASFNRMTRRLRQARAREVRTARVLAWGEMARQVAHEIKNPLTPIKLSVQHLRRAYSDRHPDFGEILDSNVSQILSEIDRLSEIARAFSRYGAPSLATGPLTRVDVGAVVHEALTLYRSGDRNVRYIEDVAEGLSLAQARPDELKEVLLNLVENSRAAIEANGEIIISAYEVDGRIDLEVSDNGPGVPPDLLSRIFEPHFSTRSSGTGLGLAIVRRLVESWGGTVTADSEPGHGTTVRIRLVPVDA
jgi:signal transduction histidine kinase